jgi:hypothetical protein
MIHIFCFYYEREFPKNQGFFRPLVPPKPLVPPNLQHVVKEIIDVDCPEGATSSERSLGKSLDFYTFNVRDYLSNVGIYLIINSFFSFNENVKCLWLVL